MFLPKYVLREENGKKSFALHDPRRPAMGTVYMTQTEHKVKMSLAVSDAIARTRAEEALHIEKLESELLELRCFLQMIISQAKNPAPDSFKLGFIEGRADALEIKWCARRAPLRAGHAESNLNNVPRSEEPIQVEPVPTEDVAGNQVVERVGDGSAADHENKSE